MSTPTRLFTGLALVCLLAFIGTIPHAPAQNGQPGAPPVCTGQFRSVPQPVPYVPTNVYAPNYNGPVGGALSGAADVIDAQGNFMVQNQQALMMREQVLQNRQDTRRKTLDEYLYERANMPTPEDENERRRIERLRASRNDPDPTEIWSGKALNRILKALQKQQAQGIKGPEIPLEEDTLTHINLTTGVSSGNFAILKNGGKVRWPLGLTDSIFDDGRKRLDQLTAQAAEQAQSGSVDPATIRGMQKAVDSLTSELRQHVSDMDINDYAKAKGCLGELQSSIRALQDPNVSNIASRKWTAKGNTVAQLTQELTRQGLAFAPAIPGDEPAYNALYHAMAAYLIWPEKPWDPLAK